MSEATKERWRRVAAFAAQLTRLSPDSWAKIEARCAHLEGTSVSSLVARARVSGEPYVRGSSQPGAGHLLFNVALELVGEFYNSGGQESQLAGMKAGVARSAHTPSMKAAMEAHLALEEVLRPKERGRPGMVTALRAVANSLIFKDFLAPERFAAIYSVVESEIPLSVVMSPEDDAA